MHVGFIGVGDLGGQILDTMLLRRVTALTVFDVNLGATERYRDVASVADDVAEVVDARCDVIGVCVNTAQQVEDVIVGAQGILASRPEPGTLIALHSTISPGICQALSAKAEAMGLSFVDAPTTRGGLVAGVIPQRVVLAGAKSDVYSRCLPYLESFGDVIEYAGPVGAAQRVKLLNNLLNGANIGLADVAIGAGEQMGLGHDVLVRTLARGYAASQGLMTLISAAPDAATGAATILQKDIEAAASLFREAQLDAPELFAASLRGIAALERLAEAERLA